MKVLHLLRKNTHLKASFILNQIQNHIDFEPVVAFYELRNKNFDGGFSSVENLNFKQIALDENQGLFSKFRYKLFKRLSGRAKKNLLKVINEHSPSVIHLHYGTDAGLYLPIISRLGIPTFVSFYGYECSGFPKRFFGLGKWYLNRFVFKYASNIFAMSEDMKKDIVALGCPESKVIVHYYGTDVKHFYNQRELVENDNIKYLIISGFTPQKGHKYLIEAFATAYNQNNSLRLTIVGAGPLEDEIRNQIFDLKLDHVVDLPGSVVYGSAELLEYFNSHDVFVHPSVTDVNGDKEGIPGALVEAMSAGIPVISTYHAGIPYIIENEKEDEMNAPRLCVQVCMYVCMHVCMYVCMYV